MTQMHEIYKCEICGNVVDVSHAGPGELVCCNQAMTLMESKKEDMGAEKHLPVMEKLPANECTVNNGVRIKIGDIPHPMDDAHYIEWVEIITKDGKRGKQFLNPGDNTDIEFTTKSEVAGARAYCNIHGLWEVKF